MKNTVAKGNKVFVAMSGGVDSSVAAFLLLESGYDVTGVFMKNWSETKNANGECEWRAERRDAERVAAKLGIPFLTFDFEEEYQREVVDYMDREYAAGRTPNPDVMCNEKIKFDAFYTKAKSMGADLIATGHYARVENGVLLQAADDNKDQTYFLYRIKPEVLRETLFPIGHLTKPELREVARRAALPTAEKKDSQGLCFVGKVNMRDFLASRIAPKQGNVVDMSGKIIGTHDGVQYYTIGQRHGLNLGLEREYYVARRDLATNTITVTHDKQDPALLAREIRIADCKWLPGSETVFREAPLAEGIRVMARIRYRAPLAAATLYPDRIVFDVPQWAPAAGQSVVCYTHEQVLGGGIITDR